MHVPIPYEPVEGKTYSLFGSDLSTSGYYLTIRELADQVLQKGRDARSVIQNIREISEKKRPLRKISSRKDDESFIAFVMQLLNQHLVGYTQNVETHLRTLPIWKFRDRRLATTREQYHLYMLEIELCNRVNINEFLHSDKKIALLPYCLRDFEAECKSAPDEFDYRCGHCSKNCYQHYISRLLKKHGIEAYIWMEADLKKFARKVTVNHRSLGVLGIACVPELTFGIRKCRKYGIPAVGIPLDANRCIRWMGEFHKNSVNLDQLEQLIRCP
jgi:hypothetical protein